MDIDRILEKVTPQIHEAMQKAVATGRWANGVELTAAQRENCLQVIIAWDLRNRATEERVGWLPEKPKKTRRSDTNESVPLRVLDGETNL